jgi:hypothetical protein
VRAAARARRLAELAARLVDARVERHRRAEQRLVGHRAGEVRHLPEPVRVDDGERRDRRVRLRAVDERDPFLRARA